MSAWLDRVLVCLLVVPLGFLVVFSPWAGGGTPVWARRSMGWVGLGLFLIGLVVALRLRRRLPRRIFFCFGMMLLLVCMGWGVSWNAASLYSFGQSPEFLQVTQPIAGFPGAVDRYVGYEYMHALWPAVGGALVAGIVGTIRSWRKVIVATMAGVGFSIAVAGLLQRAELVILAQRVRNPASPFAMFDFHGYAGSFLIVATLLCVGLALSASSSGPKMAVFFWWFAAAVTYAGLLLNVSEAAALIGTVCMITFVSIHLLAWRTKVNQVATTRKPGLVARGLAGLLVVGITAALVWLTGAGALFVGWLSGGGMTGRKYMWQSAAGIAGDAGWFGYGPGSYKLVLPQSEHLVGDLYRSWIVTPYEPGTEISFWCHACNETLQAIVEWGWFGAACWVGLFVYAVIRILGIGLRSHGESTSLMNADRSLALAVGVALLGLLMHAQVDRPMQITSLQIYAGVLLGLGWGWTRRQDQATSLEGAMK